MANRPLFYNPLGLSFKPHRSTLSFPFSFRFLYIATSTRLFGHKAFDILINLILVTHESACLWSHPTVHYVQSQR